MIITNLSYKVHMEESIHFKDMLKERGIKREWADRAILDPDRIENHVDGTRHFIKQIPEHGNRWLRLVVNVKGSPEKRVTVFFDRRLRRSE